MVFDPQNSCVCVYGHAWKKESTADDFGEDTAGIQVKKTNALCRGVGDGGEGLVARELVGVRVGGEELGVIVLNSFMRSMAVGGASCVKSGCKRVSQQSTKHPQASNINTS